MGHLLLVDSNREFTQLCSTLLKWEGHQVEVMTRIPAASSRHSHPDFDLILLDPGPDIAAGVAAAREYAPEVPLLILSGGIVAEQALTISVCSSRKRCVLLAKPFTVEAILAAVKDCLSPAAGTCILH